MARNTITAALDSLLSAQNPDGGWGWTKAKNSTTECTSFAVMAVECSDAEKHAAVLQRGLKWILDHQNVDGSWAWSDSSKVPSWATSIAILALAHSSKFYPRVLKAATWALGERGSKPGLLANLLMAVSFRNKPVKLNEDLVGWPWMPETFSWVEPTSYFLIALKRIRQLVTDTLINERIRQGEAMIYDRMCRGGGWNYGNPEVYGKSLWAYPDITAVALIALQDRSESTTNLESFAALQKAEKQSYSGLTLSWSTICHDIYGKDSTKLRQLLGEIYSETQFLGEIKVLALYILALSGGTKFFRI